MPEDWRKKITDEGESPFPAPGPRDAPEAQPDPERRKDWYGDDPQGGVSWEEVRKGMPSTQADEEADEPEKELYDEREASEGQVLNNPGPGWQRADDGSATDRAPEWPPGPYRSGTPGS